MAGEGGTSSGEGGFGYGLEQVPDDGAGLDPFAQGIVVWNDAMLQHRTRDAVQVADFRGRPTIEQGAGIGGDNQVLGGARPGAPCHVAAHEIIRAGVLGPAGGGEGHGGLQRARPTRGRGTVGKRGPRWSTGSRWRPLAWVCTNPGPGVPGGRRSGVNRRRRSARPCRPARAGTSGAAATPGAAITNTWPPASSR